MEKIKENLTRNLIALRKSQNLTQADLASILNYSDKAISKWERGESLPDIEILSQLSKLYNVTIDDLISSKNINKGNLNNKVKVLITILSNVLCWFIATTVFVILTWTVELENVWLIFIYTIPVTAIVTLVFNCLWGKLYRSGIISSILLWTLVLSFFLTSSFQKNSFIFIIAIPIQVAIIVMFILLEIKKRK